MVEENGLRRSRILANIVGPMLFVQVILGGSSTLLSFPINVHIVWGSLSFVVLLVAAIVSARDLGTKSNMFRVGIAAIIDFLAQGFLGFLAFSSDFVVVVHLANAFLLGIFVTYFIMFADAAEKAAVSKPAAMP